MAPLEHVSGSFPGTSRGPGPQARYRRSGPWPRHHDGGTVHATCLGGGAHPLAGLLAGATSPTASAAPAYQQVAAPVAHRSLSWECPTFAGRTWPRRRLPPSGDWRVSRRRRDHRPLREPDTRRAAGWITLNAAPGHGRTSADRRPRSHRSGPTPGAALTNAGPPPGTGRGARGHHCAGRLMVARWGLPGRCLGPMAGDGRSPPTRPRSPPRVACHATSLSSNCPSSTPSTGRTRAPCRRP